MAPFLDDEAEVYQALVTGLRDYMHKKGFETVIVGVSGGIDSSLVATIATDAFGPEHVDRRLQPFPLLVRGLHRRCPTSGREPWHQAA